LAEHAVASPVPYEGDDEWNDQSRYEYWNDIEYDSDGYNDVDGKKNGKVVEHSKNPASAKRKAPSKPETPSKRRKIHRRELSVGIPPVVWKVKSGSEPLEEVITSVENLKPVSLLGDWRERLKDAKGLGTSREQQDVNGVVSEEHDILLEDVEDEDLEGNDGVKLDPEVLKLALRKNLQAIGLDVAKINEATLLKLATRMTANMDKADELLGEFVESLLGTEEDEEADEFSQWALKKAEEASKDQPKDEVDNQSAVTVPSHSATEEINAMEYTHQLEDVPDMLATQPANSNPADEVNGVLSPGPSRRLKRKAESPTSPSRKKKVSRAPGQVRASS
jgi:hypothetical protein